MLDNIVNFLFVEDDDVDVDIETVQRSFKKFNVSNPLHIAKNGLEALNLLKGSNCIKKLNPTPRIVLLDINMPKMNGIEFLQAIRADVQLKSLMVFVLTTSKDDKDLIAAYDLNVAGYILKPVNFKKFLENIHTLNMYLSLIEIPNEKAWV